MRRLSLILLLFTFNTWSMTGLWEVTVEKTDESQFRGIFWSDVAETVGKGASPLLTVKDVQAAIREEFEDPQKALDQLEKLKGPGGKTLVDFGYSDYNRKRKNINGALEHRCGVIDKDGENSHLYMETGSGITSQSSGDVLRPYKRHADEGKFFQFKWASKEQIKRYVAKCFSRLPGMPALKAKKLGGAPQIYASDEIYNDFYKWYKTFPGIKLVSPTDPKVKKASNCILASAAENNPDRTGNEIVLQKAKNKEDSPHKKGTFISEGDNLPPLSNIASPFENNSHTYSIAFMDSASVQKLRKNWKNNEIQTQGIWPNYQGGSIVSLMSQSLGDEFNVHVKACFLSAGIQLANIDLVLQTIYNPYECRDIDADSIPPSEQLQMFCDDKKGQSCFILGVNYRDGKQYNCVSQAMGGSCNLVAGGERDVDKAKEYFTKACSAGTSEGCYAVAEMVDKTIPGNKIPFKAHFAWYQKGCKLKEVPECFFWNKNLNPVNEKNIYRFNSECKGKFPDRTSCTTLALHYQKIGDEPKRLQYLQAGCNIRSFNEGINPCVELSTIYVAQGKKKEAIEVLKKECTFVTKGGCKELYELSEPKDKQSVIQKACWPEKTICF